MSSLDSDVPIWELIQRIKNSFHERDFNRFIDEVKERENSLRKEIENLMWDRDLAKNEARLLDTNVELLELERSLFEEKLRKTQRKCNDLEETVARLRNRVNDERALTDRLKRASRMSTENLKTTDEKKRSISTGKLKCGNIEANEIIEESRLKKMESDKEAEMYKVSLANSTRTIKKIEENLAEISTAKMGDIATWVNGLCKYGTSEEGGNLDSRGFIGTEENSSGNDKVVVVDVGGSRNNGLSKKDSSLRTPSTKSVSVNNPIMEDVSDCHKNSVQAQTREDDVENCQKVKTLLGTQSGHNPPKKESNEPKEGTPGGGLQLLLCSSKHACSSPAADGNIIEIIDSDDDTNPDRVTQIPSIGIFDAKVVKNETNLVLTPLSCQTSKQDRTGSGDGLFVNFTAKRKKDVCTGDVDNTVSSQEKGNQTLKPTRFGFDSSLEKSNCASDEDSADSEDESLSDSKMVEMVESLKSKNIRRKFWRSI